ncbi:MAG: hypothetical protein GY841_13605 [FCB group bacterium]|nr:hypothetical protein [FCB group bacterium]
MIEHKTDHLEEAYAKLIDVFRNKTLIRAVLSAFITQIQELEDVFADIRRVKDMTEAEGDQLDGTAAIHNQARGPRSDAQMRKAITARSLLVKTGGTINEMIALLKAVLGDVDMTVTEDFPAAFVIDITDPISLDPGDIDLLKDITNTGRGAAIRVDTIIHTGTPFRYDVPYEYDIGHWATTL